MHSKDALSKVSILKVFGDWSSGCLNMYIYRYSDEENRVYIDTMLHW